MDRHAAPCYRGSGSAKGATMRETWGRAAVAVLAVLALGTGCLSSPSRSGGKDSVAPDPGSPDEEVVDETGGESGDETGEDTGAGTPSDPGDDPGEDPGVSDPGPADSGPKCPTFRIVQFGPQDGVRYARHGEVAALTATVEAPGGTPVLEVSADPQLPGAGFQGDGQGGGTWSFDGSALTFRTTPVTFTLTVSDGGCQDSRTAVVKALGNVWVADHATSTVQVFRSDGTWIGQGIANTYLSQPHSLLELPGGRIAVGARLKKGAEVFNLDGDHLYSFVTANELGENQYSVYGANTMILHQPEGNVWVGGVRERILVHGQDGQWLKSIDLGFQGPEIQSMVQLADGNVVYATDTSLDWYLVLIDGQAKEIGRWGNNKSTMDFVVDSIALAPDNRVLAIGAADWDGKGFVARLKANGNLEKHSPPLDFHPESGVAALGDLVLSSKNDQKQIALYDRDLNLVTATWTGSQESDWKGILVLGGF